MTSRTRFSSSSSQSPNAADYSPFNATGLRPRSSASLSRLLKHSGANLNGHSPMGQPDMPFHPAFSSFHSGYADHNNSKSLRNLVDAFKHVTKLKAYQFSSQRESNSKYYDLTIDKTNDGSREYQPQRAPSLSSFKSFSESTEDLSGSGVIPHIGGSRSSSFKQLHSNSQHSLSTVSTLSQHSNVSSSSGHEVPIVFVETPSEQLLCKICVSVYKDPVIMSCGHSFCKTCSMSTEECPMDNKKMTPIVSNLAVSEQVGSLFIHCRYGCRPKPGRVGEHEVNPSGCPFTVKLAERKSHENNCQYAPVACPNNSACPTMLRMQLEEHLKTCKNVKCPNHKYGCQFMGDADSVTIHVRECKYKFVNNFLRSTEEKINKLQMAIKQRDEENHFLKTMLSKTSDRVDELEKHYENELDGLGANQSKFVEELRQVRQEITVINTQLQDLNTRFHMGKIGSFDPQQIFKCKGTFVGHSGPVWCLCVHGDYLFSGSSDKLIKVWDTATTYNCQKTLEGHTNTVLALAATDDKLFSSSSDCTIKVWSISALEEIFSVDAHENPVCTLVCTNGLLFSGSLKSIKVWNIERSGVALKQELQGLNHWVRALVARKKNIYSGSYQTIKIWDAVSLECVRVIQTSGGSVYSIAVTNHHIVCGTYENCIHVWDIETHEPVTQWSGHVGIVYALSVLSSPEQTRLFSASYDSSIRVWSMENMICTQTLIRHQGSVVALAVSRGRVFSGGVDCLVKVWQ